MKILFINVCCGTGSTGRICGDLAMALDAQGHQVRIAYGRDAVPEKYQKYAVRIGSDLDVGVHVLGARLLDNAGFGSAAVTRRFLRWVQEFDPDMIHLHNIQGYYVHVGLLFAYLKNCGKKIVWTLHDCWAFTGHAAFCDSVSCTQWKTGCESCPLLQEYPKSLIDRSRTNWMRKKECFTGVPNLMLVTPSQWLAEQVKASFLGAYPVRVIHNGIDISQFRPMESDFRTRNGLEGKRVLLGVANYWDARKGLEDFKKLAARMDDRYRIILVGLRREKHPDLPENILCIERTESIEALTKIYSTADLFVNFTRDDNYPTVNLEASACGTPVLTYATGGSPESAILCAGVVEKGNVEAMVQAVEAFFETAHPKTVPDAAILRELDKKTALEAHLSLYFTS